MDLVRFDPNWRDWRKEKSNFISRSEIWPSASAVATSFLLRTIVSRLDGDCLLKVSEEIFKLRLDVGVTLIIIFASSKKIDLG